MKVKIMLAIALSIFGLIPCFSFEYRMAESALGDCRVQTCGGLTFAKTVRINICSTNEQSMAVRLVRCQIIYQNNSPTARNADSEADVWIMDELLNNWLREFAEERYAGVGDEELAECFLARNFVSDLRDGFVEYVSNQSRRENCFSMKDIDILQVCVESDGEFRDMLVKLAGK